MEGLRSRPKVKLFRYGIAAVALSAGIAGASAPGTAWADATDAAADTAGSEATSAAGPAESASAGTGSAGKTVRVGSPRSQAISRITGRPTRAAVDSATDADTLITDRMAKKAAGATGLLISETAELEGLTGADTDAAEPEQPAEAIEPVVTKTDSVTERDPLSAADPVAHRSAVRSTLGVARHEPGAAAATLTPPAELLTLQVPSAQPMRVEPPPAAPSDTTAPQLVVVTDPTPVDPTTVDPTPGPPQPLSPVAELLQLPGRLVNVVLEVLDITSSANSPTLPVSLVPINDLIFGTFRELERLLGLWDTPPAQPVVPTLTYTGPTDRPTPTVAQFLNASTAGYVLGSTPGELVPFTVNGFQMSSTNIFTGMVGKVWATPDGQLIIAYQGTTGGTHLLFNPLITISQVIADLQVVFTGTTPPAFYGALDFAERVRAEAALQGYSDDDIFVTGHSLGGWEAQFVAQQTGLAGVGFEAPGINTVVPGNGVDSMFVNIGTYGSSAPYMATDLPGLQPFMPPYVPGGGTKPHYGPIVMIGDPAAMTPLYNASALWGTSLTGSVIFLIDYLMNFFQYHLPGVQAYHLDITSDPGVVPFFGTARGPVHTGYGELTIPELMKAASDDGILFRP